MARDAAIVTSWTGSVPGREARGQEVFMDALTFWGKQAADGKCEQPEAFISQDGSGGMLIARGKSDALHDIMESDEGRKLITSAGFIVQGLTSQWFYRGDDEIQALTQMFSQVGNELGLM